MSEKRICAETILNEISEKLLNARFLQLVEKWARYKGKKFDVGDIDVVVTDMGTFKIVTEVPDFTVSNGRVQFSPDKKRKVIKTYDVTKIKNNCVCSDYDVRILIAERQPSYMNKLDKETRPAKLFIYAIDERENPDDSEHTNFPTFERLKKDFESGKYTSYNSMLREFCDDYKLIPFNDSTDRLYNYTGIESDLEVVELETNEKSIHTKIKVPKRLDRKGREEAHQLWMKRIKEKREKYEKNKKA